MNILEAMESLGIQPVTKTSRYGWFEAPEQANGRPVIFASALFNQWVHVFEPRLHGNTSMLVSFLAQISVDEAKQELLRTGIDDEVCPTLAMPGREHINKSQISISREMPIETKTARSAVIKSGMPLGKTINYCKDFTYQNNGIPGHRVFGLYNVSGGIISLDFSGKPKDLITRDMALIPGNGSRAGSCIIVVGIEVFLRIDEMSEDIVLLPSSNIIDRALSFLEHYEIINCICPSYALLRALHDNLSQSEIRISSIEPPGWWDGTLFMAQSR